jgi:hypothetical protein
LSVTVRRHSNGTREAISCPASFPFVCVCVCVCNRYPISRVCLSCATRGGFSTEIENGQVIARYVTGLCAASVSRGIDSVWTWALSQTPSLTHENLEMELTRDWGGPKQPNTRNRPEKFTLHFVLLSQPMQQKKERRETLGISTSPTSKTNRVVTKFPLRKPPAVACCCFDLPGLIRLQSREAERKV